MRAKFSIVYRLDPFPPSCCLLLSVLFLVFFGNITRGPLGQFSILLAPERSWRDSLQTDTQLNSLYQDTVWDTVWDFTTKTGVSFVLTYQDKAKAKKDVKDL